MKLNPFNWLYHLYIVFLLRPYRQFIKYPLRPVKHAWQRVVRGYDDTAYWDLNTYLAKIAAPVLRDMEVNTLGHPCGMSEDKWQSILHNMRNAMDLIVEDEHWDWDDEDRAIVDKGLKLFAKYYLDLWT